MAQITAQERIQRVQELLDEVHKFPPEQHETQLIQLTAGPKLCDVIKMKADEVLLNHRSHRIRSQLEDDPQWEEVKADPHSEAAQKIIQHHVRHARHEDKFNELKESLLKEGQAEPGVMTHDGVLVNANTRAVAMREMDDPAKRYLRVAVLPKTIQPDEIGLLELRLQMQKELKVEYSLTNELLFIEELSNERGMSDEVIASELRLNPESPKKGAQEVAMRLKYLDLLRTLQRIPSNPLRLHQFDVIALQHLKDVYATHQRLLEQDPIEADTYLQSFLLSVLVDVKAVHQIRVIDPDFVGTYVLPSLEEDEMIGQHVAKLAAPAEAGPGAPKGAKALLGGGGEQGNGEAPNVVRLIDAVAGHDHNIKIPGGALKLERNDVRDAIKSAYESGIKEKKRDERESNRLEAPTEAVKTATREIAKAQEALKAALTDPEFVASYRKTLEANFKKLTRTLRTLEQALGKANIISS